MLKLITHTKELLNWRDSAEKEVGFVPTMGNLHQGHLSLIESSLNSHPFTVVSIFVNPKQFGPGEDFERYPRTLARDCQLIEKLLENYPNKELIVYAPASIDEIFPSDFSTHIQVTKLTEKLCGQARPGHFQGVTTVVYRLFSLVRPSTAFFGQKDYQQCMVIKKMVHDLILPIKIEMGAIVREESGLALSSRNQYLSEDEKQSALILPSTLISAAKILTESQSFQKASDFLQSQESPFEYLTMLDANNLEECLPTTKFFVLLGAIKIGKTRLIDNILVQL